MRALTQYLIIFVALSCLGLGPAVTNAADLRMAKLDLNFLTKKQHKKLRWEMRVFAFFDARLATCGIHESFEKRATAAIIPCLKLETIISLRNYYEKWRKLSLQSLREHPSTKLWCTLKKGKKWLKGVKALLEDRLRELDRMCRACLPCRG